MSRNRRKKSQKGQIKQKTPIIPVVQDDNREEQYSKIIDIREKRINIVFKTIYVFAIFFVTVFIDMVNRTGQEVDVIYVCEACLSTFFLVVMSYMILYIINEMKSLKLHASDLSKIQIDITERSYSNIFSALSLSGFGAGLCLLIFSCGNNFFTAEIAINLFVALFMLRMILFTVGIFVKEKQEKVIEHCVGCLLITLAIALMFYGVGLSANI